MRKLRTPVLGVDFTKAKAAAEDEGKKGEEGGRGGAHDALHELMSLEVSLA